MASRTSLNRTRATTGPSPSVATPTDEGAIVKTDGRRARRDRNHVLVLDTVRQLFMEENLFPSIEAVAQRSGVSVRSLYRYFEDLESLIGAAVQRSMEIGAQKALIPSFGRGPLEQRLIRFADARVSLFEQQGSGFRVARLHAPTVPQLRDALDATRRFLREQVEGQFAPELRELARRERFVALAGCDAISQFDSLDYLRRDRQVTVTECKAIIVRAIERNLRV